MKILAFETSAKAASVALMDNGKLLGENYQNTGMTHSQTLMVMAEDLLKTAGLTVKDVDAVAVAAFITVAVWSCEALPSVPILPPVTVAVSEPSRPAPSRCLWMQAYLSTIV